MRSLVPVLGLLLAACATPAPPIVGPAVSGEADAAPAASRGTLTVTVRGVLPQASQLLVGLFDEGSYAGRTPPFSRDGPAKSPETIVVFADLVPGLYAVKVLQDLNGNRDMDFTLLGMPAEPFGFSNDAKPLLGEPPFGETSFEVKPGPNAVVMHLQAM